MKNKLNLSLFVKYITVGLFATIVIYLLILSGFSTTGIDEMERSYLIEDSFWMNVLVNALFVLALWGGYRLLGRLNIRERFPKLPMGKKLVKILLLVAFFGDLLFVLCISKSPRADQFDVCKVAFDMSNGDFSALDVGGYLSVNTNQAGIVLLLYALGKIFGHYNYTVFQVLNIFAVLMLTKCFISWADDKEKTDGRAVGIVVLRVAFLPIVFYTTFVYGTIIGLALGVWAFNLAQMFKKERKPKYAILSFVCMFLAIAVKQNYAIFGIALALYIVFLLIKSFKKYIYMAALLAAVVVSVVFNGAALDHTIKLISGRSLGEGMSPFSWVNMGLKEGSPLFDGWYDNSNSTFKAYYESGYNKDLHEERSIDGIEQSVNRFKNDPHYALDFFSGKNASQWNNPGFQGWWINYAMPEDGVIQMPTWLDNLLSIENYNDYIFPYLDRLQFIILFGVVLFIFFCKEKNEAAMFFMLTFIGGFVFHTVWEAKAQYTFVYFVLLLPMAVDGYIKTVKNLDALLVEDKKKLAWGLGGYLLTALAVFMAVRTIPFCKDIFMRDEDTELYSDYVAFHTYVEMPRGEYVVSPLSDAEVALAAGDEADEEDKTALYYSDADDDSAVKVEIQSNEEYSTVRFMETNLCLDVPEGIGKQDGEVYAYMPDGSDAQKWNIAYNDETGAYYIIYNKVFALSYDVGKNRVYLSYFDGSEAQKWNINECA